MFQLVQVKLLLGKLIINYDAGKHVMLVAVCGKCDVCFRITPAACVCECVYVRVCVCMCVCMCVGVHVYQTNK